MKQTVWPVRQNRSIYSTIFVTLSSVPVILTIGSQYLACDAEIWECLGVKGLVYLLYHWLAIYNITLYQTVLYQPLPWMGTHGSIMVRDAHFIVTSEGLCYSWSQGKVWLLYLIITIKKYEPIAIDIVRSLNNAMHCVSFCDLISILSTLARYLNS